jgi:8-oxo-dGTP pyrophosphatase MutT (NUDIX family)
MPAPLVETLTIRRLLDAHQPVDAAECESMRRILTLLGSAKNPFSREHYHPGHLTASGIVLNPAHDKALLIFHTKLQRWLQPGGHFEPGESDPAVAAAREVLEETGLAVETDSPPPLLDVDVHAIPARKTEPAHFHFDLRMLFVAREGEAQANEVQAVRWAQRSEFAEMELDHSTLRALKKCGF